MNNKTVWRLGGALAVVFAMAMPSAAENLDLTLSLVPSADPDTNRFAVDYTIAALGNSDTQSTTTDASGNVLASMDVTFDPITHQATVNSIAFSAGAVSLTDMSLSFTNGSLSYDLTANGLAGYVNTSGAASTVAAGIFPASDHEVVVDDGLISTNPATISHDLNAVPIVAALDAANASITFALGSLVNNTATYDISLTLPTAFTQMFQATVNLPGVGDVTFDETLEVDGAIVATGTYVRTGVGILTPEPGSAVLGLFSMFAFAWSAWRVRRRRA
jgi:hypothetical protein